MFFKKISISEKSVVFAALGLLGSVALSWPLWGETACGSFPMLPLFGDAASKGGKGLGGFLLPIFTTGLILCAVVFPYKKWLIATLAGWLLWLCCLDLNRLQPWAWFCLLVFAAIFFGKKENEALTVNALRWLLAGVYFWSGLNKLTPYFAEDNFAWFCEAFALTKPFGRYPALGYAVALFEISFAAGLLWEKTRPCFRWLIVGFHGVIILFLLKSGWNWVVVPWNVAMAGIVWVLCPRNPTPGPSPNGRGDAAYAAVRSTSPLPLGEGPGVGLTRGGIGIVALAWLAPAFHLAQLWPYNLSWQLYSNTQAEATFYSEGEGGFFCESDSSENHTQKMWVKFAFDNGTKLLLDDWANDEIRVPMFVSERTFRQMGKYLCRCNSKPDSAGLFILRVNRWDKSAERLEKIPCSELLRK